MCQQRSPCRIILVFRASRGGSLPCIHGVFACRPSAGDSDSRSAELRRASALPSRPIPTIGASRPSRPSLSRRRDHPSRPRRPNSWSPSRAWASEYARLPPLAISRVTLRVGGLGSSQRRLISSKIDPSASDTSPRRLASRSRINSGSACQRSKHAGSASQPIAYT
jgi:hypothetical protein